MVALNDMKEFKNDGGMIARTRGSLPAGALRLCDVGRGAGLKPLASDFPRVPSSLLGE